MVKGTLPRKLVGIHPSPIALVCRSFPIDGSARFTAEARKGVRKAANAVTSNTDLLRPFSSVAEEVTSIIYYSLFFVSIIIVTGPSLIISTTIFAPNSPVSIFFPRSPESLPTNFS